MPDKKFGHEKLNRRDLVLTRGGDPVWMGIKQGDEYLIEDDIARLRKHVPEGSMRAPKSQSTNHGESAVELSEESMAILSKVLLSHPETRIGEYSCSATNGTFEIRFAHSNKIFARELVSALKRYDQIKASNTRGH